MILENWAAVLTGAFSLQMRVQNSLSVDKKALRLDEVHFIRSWLEKPLSTGAVLPSGKALARTMARYVDPNVTGPVIELGPGTGAVTEALVEQGIEPSRLVLVESTGSSSFDAGHFFRNENSGSASGT